MDSQEQGIVPPRNSKTRVVHRAENQVLVLSNPSALQLLIILKIFSFMCYSPNLKSLRAGKILQE